VAAIADAQAPEIARKLLALRAAEQERLRRIADYMAGRHDSVYVPRGARQEYRWMIRRARVNVLPLVVTVTAQNLYVEGYRPERASENAKAWEYWQANRMDGRQHGLHRAVLKYGVAYCVVLPGEFGDRHAATSAPVITPKSPRRMTAYYADPVEDEWPLYAVEVRTENQKDGKTRRVVRLYDEERRFTLVGGVDGGNLELDDIEEHGLGVCPVVRYLSGDDLDGDDCVRGEVEPLIDNQDQLNATVFGRMMAEQYAVFRQRWAAGLVVEDDEGRAQEPFQAAVDKLWVTDNPDAKFGEFGATDLTAYLRSAEETIRHIATISQTPPHHLLGQMANLSAEALNAARDGLNSKVAEYKSLLGEAHEQTLRLAALAAGDEDGWRDTAAQIVWRDTESRSLAQTVDALGKLAQMLQVPPEVLWERIPGVTQQDVERWRAAAQEADPMRQLTAVVDGRRSAVRDAEAAAELAASAEPVEG